MKEVQKLLVLMLLCMFALARAVAQDPALVTIGNFVWHDGNVNGLQERYEHGLSLVTVKLYTGSGELVATTATDADGKYQFSVAPGTYYVQFMLPWTYNFTLPHCSSNDDIDSDADANTGKTPSFTLTPGEANLTLDCGVYRKTGVGNYVWRDTNGNGIQDDDEPAMAGVTVILYTEQGGLVSSMRTTSRGRYYFFVPAGTYYLQFILPANYAFSPQCQGIDPGYDSNADPTTGKTACFTLKDRQYDLTRDAGMYKRPCIGDIVWKDMNANGIQDSGEYGRSGVTVNLCNSEGAVLATATTDKMGRYRFYVDPGSYRIQFVLPPDAYYYSPTCQGSDSCVDSDADCTTGLSPVLTLTYEQQELTCDAGVYKQVWIGNYVWNDINADGIQNLLDSAESGIAGVTVKLLNSEGVVVAEQQTNFRGLFMFIVNPGVYRVQVLLPDGYAFSPQYQGKDYYRDSDIDPATGMTPLIKAPAGVKNYSVDAGLVESLPQGAKSTIVSSFKDPCIPAGRTIWFYSVVNLDCGKRNTAPTEPITLRLIRSKIQFSADGVCYTVPVPDTMITFCPTALDTSTSYDAASKMWHTIVPLAHADNAFLSGVAFPVPVDLPAGIDPVCWEGYFLSDTDGVRLTWKWGAAVYTELNTDYNTLAVKVIPDGDDLLSSDHIGMPENYQAYQVDGARCTGNGSGYTTDSHWVTPTVLNTP